MKKLLSLSLLFVSCASTQPVTTTPPIVTTDTITRVVHDTVMKVSHDTSYISTTIEHTDTMVVLREWLRVDTAFVPLAIDTTQSNIVLRPMGGPMQDDQPQIQAAVNTARITGQHIFLHGRFWIRRPIVIAYRDGLDYAAAWCWISGTVPNQNSPGGTIIYADFTDGPAFAIQEGKGAILENLWVVNTYIPPNAGDRNIFRRAQWRDKLFRDCPTSPCAGIVIDPFSDPKYIGGDTTKMYPSLIPYYLPGMSRSGSTAIQINNCNFTGFSVGVLITAVNQQNGECITIDHCQFTNCMSAIASTQAQAKTNWVTHTMVWGGVHTIIDGVHYGLPQGDMATVPEVDGMNIAGINYQYIQCFNNSFKSTHRNVYSEGTYRIGSTGAQYTGSGGAGTSFQNCTFDFILGGRSQPYIYHGGGTDLDHCNLRYYNGGQIQERVVINDWGDEIRGGVWGAAPVTSLGQALISYPRIDNLMLYYKNPFLSLINGSVDSIVQSSSVLLRITDTVAGAGYYISSDTAGLQPGTMILTVLPEEADSLSVYKPSGSLNNYQVQAGNVGSTSKDTVYLQNIERDLKDSTSIPVYKALFKKKPQ